MCIGESVGENIKQQIGISDISLTLESAPQVGSEKTLNNIQ